MEPLTGCSQTGLPLSTGSLPVVYGTTGYVQRFPAARVNPGAGRKGRRRLRVSRTQFLSAGPDSSDHHKCVLAYPSIFSRLTTGLDFTTSVFELPCASSTLFNCKYCVYRLYILHVVQPADIIWQGFSSAAQFLTVNSGRRFFNRTPSVLLSSTSECPSHSQDDPAP